MHGRQAIPADQASKIVDKDSLRTAIRRHDHEILQCYSVAVKAQPSLAGRLILNLSYTGAEGRVRKAYIDKSASTIDDKSLNECVVDRAMSWRFPPTPEQFDVVVTYPYTLSPAKKL